MPVQSVMPIERIPDWEQRLARVDACWENEILDRAVVNIRFSEPNPAYPWPAPKAWGSLRERWMDADYVAACALAGTMNTAFMGDALPGVYPNLGPEIFSAFFGCELEFGEMTSWSIPNLHDWSDTRHIRFSEDNVYWKKIAEMTDALLAVGRGVFYTGITDLHPGADAIVAFRDPLNMNLDMLEAVDDVKAMLDDITDTYLAVYDTFYNKLAAAGQAITTWPGIVSSKKWYVPSNDFSCMVSKAMFDDVFLPGLIRECDHMEANIYHLDGPQALQHLDSLLGIPSLNTIQWIHGEGHGRSSDWMPIYQKCQAAGKGIQLHIDIDELDLFMATLKPHGVFMTLFGVTDRAMADAVIKKVAAWR
jgi:hypothetical protein